jgi:hypothetical protein
MAFVLVHRIGLPRPIIAVAVATAMAASALIPKELAQDDAAKPAEMAEGGPASPAKIDDVAGAAAVRVRSQTGRAEAADNANGPPSEPSGAAMESRKRALIILMLQNDRNRPFGSFK